MTILIRERDGTIKDLFTGAVVPRTRRYYVSDGNGLYHVPEVAEARRIMSI